MDMEHSAGKGMTMIANANREKLQKMWKTEGVKSRARRGWKSWKYSESNGTGGTASKILDGILFQECFNKRIWRMTSTLVLPEREKISTWSDIDIGNFVYDVIHSGEIRDCNLQKLLQSNPALRDNPETTMWLDGMMLPFRSAVLTQLAIDLLEKALFNQQACNIPERGPEWNHLSNSTCVTDYDIGRKLGGRDDVIDFLLDDFERYYSSSEQATIDLSPDTISLAGAGHPVASFLLQHVRVSKGGKADVQILKTAAESGFIPAQIAWSQITKNDTYLREILNREDGLTYPVAAYALAKNADYRRDDNQSMKWHEEHLNYCDDSSISVQWAPLQLYSLQTYPFSPLVGSDATADSKKNISKITANRNRIARRAMFYNKWVVETVKAIRLSQFTPVYVIFIVFISVLLHLTQF